MMYSSQQAGNAGRQACLRALEDVALPRKIRGFLRSMKFCVML